MSVKCDTCKFLIIKEDELFCEKLGIILYNGYQMDFHSKRCGE